MVPPGAQGAPCPLPQLRPLGPPPPAPVPAPAAALRRRRHLKTRFDEVMDALPYFLVQLEDPFQEEMVHTRLQKIWQETQRVSEDISQFCQLAGAIQDWPETEKIHLFRKGLHPEVAPWRALVAAEPTTLAGGGSSNRLCGDKSLFEVLDESKKE
uniref:Uncharacterized protein n=1 Tax=Sphaerodactylus townsendi TaxID=933632 RepID=A0ACB8FFV8_9SAUR